MNDAVATKREFEYSEKDFKNVKDLIYKIAGISLSDLKIQLVYSRLAPRLRANGLKTFRDYLSFIETDKDEANAFINALTTNKTSFFREPHHFKFLEQTIIPEILKRKKRIKIWSAGCSSGEEPYTIAITLYPYLQQFSGGIDILATDLDTKVLDKGQKGVYPIENVADIEQSILKSYFLRGTNNQRGMVKVAHQLTEMITFKQLNLMEAWPFRGKFDLIFCRNVVIYFDKDTQKRLFERFYDALDSQCWLMIGHSESVGKLQDKFEFLGQTIYQKKG